MGAGERGKEKENNPSLRAGLEPRRPSGIAGTKRIRRGGGRRASCPGDECRSARPAHRAAAAGRFHCLTTRAGRSQTCRPRRQPSGREQRELVPLDQREDW
ncbi:zinc finger protein 664 isoform X4 [Heterocephalus glaber]|uniref:Zinc finger protein 664 isoform X4 n=1 Tax=Heterocephalus glaber TaxID=10181 RepID=A0AAX6QV00_HETGA|nr:zinc finger protein 664 isoform X4 [Heterocephalus glaber]